MATPLEKFDPSEASQFLLGHGHCGMIGLTYHAHGPDWVEVELPWRDDLVSEAERGILASGPIISLLDMASGLAIWTATGAFMNIATLDLRVDYQRPARKNAAVIGHVECYRITKSAVFVRGFAHDGDPEDSVATMSGTFMVVGQGTTNG